MNYLCCYLLFFIKTANPSLFSTATKCLKLELMLQEYLLISVEDQGYCNKNSLSHSKFQFIVSFVIDSPSSAEDIPSPLVSVSEWTIWVWKAYQKSRWGWTVLKINNTMRFTPSAQTSSISGSPWAHLLDIVGGTWEVQTSCFYIFK